MVMRQALAGMLWSKQYFYYDLNVWLREHQVGPASSPEVEAEGAKRRVVPHVQQRHYLDAG